jgi:hypothetical protein
LQENSSINLRDLGDLDLDLELEAGDVEIDLARCCLNLQNLGIKDTTITEISSFKPGILRIQFNRSRRRPSIQIKWPSNLNSLLLYNNSIQFLDPRTLLAGINGLRSFYFSMPLLSEIKSCLLEENKITLELKFSDLLLLRSSNQ